MATQGNWVGYYLEKWGNVLQVYAGITQDPDEREKYHDREGTNGHDTFRVVTGGMTKPQALRWEAEQRRKGIPTRKL